jgi:hypothetical protein
MRPNDDIFGCFGNNCSECVLSTCWPCLLFGEMTYEDSSQNLGYWGGCSFYTCCLFCPCIPGTYLRITRNESWLTGCLSYTFCPCCALLQDERRSMSYTLDKQN